MELVFNPKDPRIQYDRTTRTFTSEASDLQGYFYVPRRFEKGALGMSLRSPKTGVVLHFLFDSLDDGGEAMDGEGEVISWSLTTADGQFKLTVYND